MSAQAHQSTIETVRRITDADGQSVLLTNRYVELATGLNRQDPQTGQWVRAKDTIETFDRGFVAQNTAHQALWPRTLDGSSVIDVLDAEGQRYRSRVLGLSWFDAASGKSAIIAETQPSTGRLAASNTVLYPNAFAGVKADLAYVNRRDGLAQEVILREALPGPKLWGLNPETTRLEVMTEFVEAPAATVKPRFLRIYRDKTVGNSRLCRVLDNYFANLTDDFLLVQTGEFWRDLDGDGYGDLLENGELFVAHWYGGELQTQELTDDTHHQLEHALFAPLTIPFE